jgi:hypothetical protein
LATLMCAFVLIMSPNGKQDAGDQSHAQNDSRGSGYFDDESPSWVKWHTLF